MLRRSRGFACREAAPLSEALEELAAGRVQAVVYGKPLLEWRVNREYAERLVVLPAGFRPESYAIALPNGSPLREPINRLIPALTGGDRWTETLRRHLGR